MKISKIFFSILLCDALLMLPAQAAGALDPSKASPGKQMETAVVQPMAVVNIPDANLKKYLHGKTGIPQSKPIYRKDLAVLTGKLEPKDKNIANAEGIQYCISLEELDMSGNKLSAVPELKNMTKLKSLNLSGNKFTELPDEICGAPKLENLNMDKNKIASLAAGFSKLTLLKSLTLSDNELQEFPDVLTKLMIETLNISGNPIEYLPDNISDMTGLRYFTASGCKIKKIPDKFYSMTWMRKINFNGNELSSISKSIKNLDLLESVYLNRNKLQTLPSEICALPKLKILSLNGNALNSLPSKTGDLKLEELNANKNNLTALPGSIGGMATLKRLDVRLNRLKKLPSGLDKINFENLNVEWNFLDVSDTSSTKKMLEGVNAALDCLFIRQLTPIQNHAAASTPDSITLFWDKCADGGDDFGTWTVSNYTVYAVDGDKMLKTAEIPPSDTSCTVTGLAPSTIYTYKISVEYNVTDTQTSFDGTTRNIAEIKVRTADAKQTAEPTPSAMAAVELTPEPTPVFPTTPKAAEATVFIRDEEKAESTLLYIALGAVTVIAAAAIVLVIVVLVRKKPNAG